MRLIVVVVTLTLFGGATASADDAAEWVERSHEAVFESSQVVTCQTPDGQVDGVFEVAGTGLAVQAGQGPAGQVYGANGVFGVAGSSQAIAIPTEQHAEMAATYSAIEVTSERFDGRRTKAFHVSRDGVLRAAVVFDYSTGALVSMTTYNADGTEYCVVETTAFTQAVGLSEMATLAEPLVEMERIDPDPVAAPTSVAGFVRLDAHRWRESGSASFYSDGLFSFTLLHAPSAFELADSDASDVTLGKGTYRRLFEPGRATYVWESETGGMSIVGDLPLDLQEAVLAELAPAERPGLLTRLWRRLFR